jgi:hypothetical protein
MAKQNHTVEFKENAAKLADELNSIAETARGLGMEENNFTTEFINTAAPLSRLKQRIRMGICTMS